MRRKRMMLLAAGAAAYTGSTVMVVTVAKEEGVIKARQQPMVKIGWYALLTVVSLPAVAASFIWYGLSKLFPGIPFPESKR